MEANIKNFLKYRNLLWEMVKRDIKKKYKNSFLGILWSVINPLLMMLVLTYVFTAVFHKNKITHFAVYILSARLLYTFFADATKFAMKSIVQNRSLIKKVYIPKYIFPLSKICSTFIIFLISFIPLIGVMLYYRVEINADTFKGLIALVFLFFISTGIGLILSTVNVFFRDMEHLYSVLLTMIMYMSAIFYPVKNVEKLLRVLKLNPIFDCIWIFRYYILQDPSAVSVPDSHVFLRCIIYSVVYVGLGVYLFKKNQDKFIFNI
ncbi:ABC transporter permease [Clostridium oryzae]|uniref:Transport permease protein n=1 Tax=Clostridium oryzae TaxID=1450648 RepID=A0A1V4IYT2_9CLOT|nr:ABC transporter permease [Clostridium oryzae]OPJ65053.1 teichoic acid translocation permease protein TagG [Clostridium oryzae]